MSPFDPTVLIFLALNIHLISSNSAVTYHLYYYTLSVIENLSSTDPGAFTCVFYDKQPDYPPENILERLMASPQLNHIPKLSIDGSLPHVPFGLWPETPSLILYRAGNSHWSFDEQMFHTLSLFHPNTRMLVFLDCTRAEYFEANSAVIVELLRFNRVVYLCTTQFTVARTELDWGMVTELSHYPEAAELFQDVLRDLRGLPIPYTWRQVEKTVEDTVRDPAALWILETSKLLNGSCVLKLCPCPLEERGFDECFRKFLKSDMIEFTLEGVIATAQPPGNVRLIYYNVPDTDLLLIPKGRPLNVVELFFVPFTWSAWMLIALLLAVTELTSILKPTLFRNDPIMTVVCSFERYNLHRAGRFEKFLLQSLIVTFFFLSNAYETKIIALMTAKPALRIPKTLQDLVERQIPIKVDLRKDPDMLKDTQIGHLVQHSIVHFLVLDGTSAYKIDKTWFAFHKVIPYLGIYQNERRYTQLQQTLGIQIMGFYTSYRSPFVEQFSRTLNLFEETGIMAHWKANVVLGALRHPLLSNRNIVVSGVLPYRLDDLMLAWAALAAGVGAAMLVFALEVAVNYCLVRMGVLIKKFQCLTKKVT